MTINQRKTKINAFFRKCHNNGLEVSHSRINRYFKDPLNRIMVEMIAVRHHTYLNYAKIGYRECARLLTEAIEKHDKLPYIYKKRKKQDAEQRKFDSIQEAS